MVSTAIWFKIKMIALSTLGKTCVPQTALKALCTTTVNEPHSTAKPTKWQVDPETSQTSLRTHKASSRISCILNQSFNATRKWLDFCMNMWCRTIYLRYIVQLLTKNLWGSVSNVSTARLSELWSYWSKRLFESQALAKRLNIKNFSRYPTPTLGQ